MRCSSTAAPRFPGPPFELTNGGKDEAGSVFFTSPVNVQSFTTDFTFQLTNANRGRLHVHDSECRPRRPRIGRREPWGMRASARVWRSSSIFTKMREIPSGNSTGVFVDGAFPIGPWSIDLTGSGINLHSGDTDRRPHHL